MGVKIKSNDVVLFQGDSITDAGRSIGDGADLGKGYAMMAAGLFGSKYPEKQVTFKNRGISGNRVKDLQGRWRLDCLDLRPDWVSIYIGINDTWRRYDSNDPTTAEAFEEGYRDLLNRTREAVGRQIILFEPFVLPVKEGQEKWREDLDPKIQVVRRLATEFKTLLVPLDGLFAQASTLAPGEYWAADGVHPTPAGHMLIAKAWLQTVGMET